MQVEVSLFRKIPFSNALLLPLPIILSCIFYPFCITNGFLLFTTRRPFSSNYFLPTASFAEPLKRFTPGASRTANPAQQTTWTGHTCRSRIGWTCRCHLGHQKLCITYRPHVPESLTLIAWGASEVGKFFLKSYKNIKVTINSLKSPPPNVAQCLVIKLINHLIKFLIMLIRLIMPTLDQCPGSNFLRTNLDWFEANWILEFGLNIGPKPDDDDSWFSKSGALLLALFLGLNQLIFLSKTGAM